MSIGDIVKKECSKCGVVDVKVVRLNPHENEYFCISCGSSLIEPIIRRNPKKATLFASSNSPSNSNSTSDSRGGKIVIKPSFLG